MIDIYAKSCIQGSYYQEKYGKSPDLDKVKTYLTRKLKSGDWYINSQEAVHYGFADRVLDDWQKIN